ADLLEAPAGSIWLRGHTRSETGEGCSMDLWLLKINDLGEMVQSHIFPAGGEAAAVSLRFDTDGNLLVLANKFERSGAYNYPYGNVWALKINTLGEVQWQTTIGIASLNERPAAIFAAPGGGYFLWLERRACSPLETNCQAATEGLVLKLDENGNELERHSFDEAPYDVRQTPDNGFIVNGYRYFKSPVYPNPVLENEYRLVKFNFRDAPHVELGNDTLLCPWETLPLDAGSGENLDYAWSTGEQTQSLTAHPGSYAVTVTDAKNCSRSDEIMLTPCATFDLQTGNFCDTILLDANMPNADFLW
ncbi:MAG: hypothetical protein AAB316_04050, partial [Bacteroidota bacterium]